MVFLSVTYENGSESLGLPSDHSIFKMLTEPQKFHSFFNSCHQPLNTENCPKIRRWIRHFKPFIWLGGSFLIQNSCSLCWNCLFYYRPLTKHCLNQIKSNRIHWNRQVYFCRCLDRNWSSFSGFYLILFQKCYQINHARPLSHRK